MCGAVVHQSENGRERDVILVMLYFVEKLVTAPLAMALSAHRPEEAVDR